MNTSVPLSLAELTEIKAYTDFVTGATAPVQEALGIDFLSIDSALALVIREDPSQFFNRAGGFGSGGPLKADALAQVCDFYRKQGISQGSFMIAPSLLPPDWASTVARLKLTDGRRYVKLGCDIQSALSATDGIAALAPGLRVGLVEPHQANEWGAVMMAAFGFSLPGMTDVAASCVSNSDWRPYAVWDGDRIIAVGSLFINGECANMFGAATLPSSRGRGAQSALLTIRARAAEAAGCRWLVAETGAENPGEHNTSLHNMLRAGFEPLYERPTWVWRK
ncbi:N-acetyltransferase family protein (plasmid) [Streptomyces sp. HUAS TT11]|uniref:GNAT family N-acetyltransferase n=1 Tax=Streptomyces sp. HUAS TT11 TaxID=3447508 RepID=UPI003F656138